MRIVKEDCHNDVINLLTNKHSSNKLPLNGILYSECVIRETHDIKTKSENNFIERDQAIIKRIGSIFHPSVTLNDRTFRGDYTDPN